MRMGLYKILRSNAGVGLTILRVVTGTIFIGHGLPKFGYFEGHGLEATAGFLGSIGLPFPDFLAVLLASTEVFGGIGLILGLMTRPFGLALAFAMLVAIFGVHWPHGMFADGGYEWALLLCAASLALMIEGGGRYAADNWISDKL